MNASLRDRITRKLESLADDRGYQILDYVEFLESKYAERQAPPPNVFTRFAEGVEDTMRAGRVSTQAIAQTMDLMNKAMGVLTGVTAAGKSMASDVFTTASQLASNPLAKPPAPGAGPGASGTNPAAPPPASAPAGTIPPAGSPGATSAGGGDAPADKPPQP